MEEQPIEITTSVLPSELIKEKLFLTKRNEEMQSAISKNNIRIDEINNLLGVE